MTDQKLFAEMDLTERLAFMRRDPAAYEKAMEPRRWRTRLSFNGAAR